jgi:hypothetical protein
VLGVSLFTLGAVIHNDPLLAIGLGMYLSHGLEEMYYNHTPVPAAFFVFITQKPRAGRRPAKRSGKRKK